MIIEDIGIDDSLGKEFEENRPNGIGFWLLILIKSRARFHIDGESIEVRKPSYILLKPNTPVRYGPLRGTFDVNWISFRPNEEDLKWMDESKLETDKPVPLMSEKEVNTLIKVMHYEHYLNDEVHEDVETHLMKVLYLLLYRQTSQVSNGPMALPKGKYSALNELRAQIFTSPGEIGSVDHMAGQIGVSRSGLQHMYKKMFGVPISTDVIASRINYSKKLLGGTKYTLRDIAKKCGYQNEFYFMRQFKDVTDMTPSEYRNSL